jgi:choice-of-anchor C domain-containing protein
VNLTSGGVVSVAILGTELLGVPAIDPASVCFGDAEDTGQRDCTDANGRGAIEDVNNDGFADLLLHFEIVETGIDAGDERACLTGATVDGRLIAGCDRITTFRHPPSAVTSLVVNGGFESPDVGAFGVVTFFAPDSLDSWSVESGSVDLVAAGVWTPASGTQSLDLSGDDAGSIAQDIATTAGRAYTLSFSYAGNTAITGDPGCAAGDEIKQVEVFWDGESVGSFSFDVTGHDPVNMGWREQRMRVVASRPLTEVQFASLNAGRCGIALDEVKVAGAG